MSKQDKDYAYVCRYYLGFAPKEYPKIKYIKKTPTTSPYYQMANSDTYWFHFTFDDIQGYYSELFMFWRDGIKGYK